jgi:LSU ribosomal protein L24E
MFKRGLGHEGVVRIYNCSYCGKPIPPGYGLMYVRVDGVVLRFCSRKCFVSMVKMGRNPQKQAWVRKAKRVKQATQPGKPTAK